MECDRDIVVRHGMNDELCGFLLRVEIRMGREGGKEGREYTVALRYMSVSAGRIIPARRHLYSPQTEPSSTTISSCNICKV